MWALKSPDSDAVLFINGLATLRLLVGIPSGIANPTAKAVVSRMVVTTNANVSAWSSTGLFPAAFTTLDHQVAQHFASFWGVDQSNIGLWQTMEQEKNSSKLASSRYTLLATRQLGSTRSWNLPTFRRAPSIITSRARMPSPRRSWNTITLASRNVGNRFSKILRFLHSNG